MHKRLSNNFFRLKPCYSFNCMDTCKGSTMVVYGKVIKLLITILMLGLSSAAYSQDYQAGKNFTVIDSPVKQSPQLVEFFSF